ncbi:ubiquitin-conjugating enzyme E2 W isoform X1 [Zalophus californianus]|uniref:Ubiquitin-conjugating enzyme E2 W isoform X1 n=1 Tax=Zalophus californianus TaxID=9704 RepID=A0A6P9F7C9_ZALCA|nr:ubiquitin-conjugating enzyme E2 W isoform X1 [Zalophus californianus]
MLGPRGVTRARQLRPLRLWPRRPWGDGSIMASMQKRLQKELLALQNDPPPGMTLNEKSVQNSITQWIVDMEGAPGTLYEGEKFQLLFKFSSRYPFDSPQKTGPQRSQSSQFVLALLACFPAAKKRDDHQIILFMFEHVTRIQRKQNGGIMMILVDATVIILLAEDSPTEKMSTLIIQSLNFNL